MNKFKQRIYTLAGSESVNWPMKTCHEAPFQQHMPPVTDERIQVFSKDTCKYHKITKIVKITKIARH